MRGDDPAYPSMNPRRTAVSPACAGMIPLDTGTDEEPAGEPRMRGDDPADIAHGITYFA